jgi:hypothetical protein
MPSDCVVGRQKSLVQARERVSLHSLNFDVQKRKAGRSAAPLRSFVICPMFSAVRIPRALRTSRVREPSAIEAFYGYFMDPVRPREITTDALFHLQLRVARRADELAEVRYTRTPLNLYCWLLAEAEVLGGVTASRQMDALTGDPAPGEAGRRFRYRRA